MNDFNRKVEEASARINKSVAEVAATVEKETAELIAHLNDDVVPVVRQHSTKAFANRRGEVSEPRRLYGESPAPQVSDCLYGNPNNPPAIVVFVCLFSFLLTGCGEHKQAQVYVPPPPLHQFVRTRKAKFRECRNPQLKTTIPAESEPALSAPAVFRRRCVSDFRKCEANSGGNGSRELVRRPI